MSTGASASERGLAGYVVVRPFTVEGDRLLPGNQLRAATLARLPLGRIGELEREGFVRRGL